MQSSQTRFLPQTMVDFFKRSVQELLGVCFLVATLVLVLSFVSYTPVDPSFNTATLQAPANWLSFFGSYLADIMLQFFGFTTLVWIVIFAAWGYRLLCQNTFSLSLVHCISALLATLGTGIFLTGFAPFDSYFQASSLPFLSSIPSQGGVLSFLLFWNFQKILAFHHLSFLLKPILLALFGIGFLCAWYAAGLSLKQLKKLVIQIYRLFVWIIRAIILLFNTIVAFANKKNIQPKSYSGEDLYEDNSSQKVRFETLEDIPEIDWRHSEVDASEEEYDQFPFDESDNNTDLPTIFPPKEFAEKTNKVKKSDFKLPEHLINTGDYNLPPVDLLDKTIQKSQAILPEVLQEQARLLEEVLSEFGIRGEIVNIRPGPVVTLYELKPAPGIKTSRVIGLADDIARSMSALSARIAVIPGQNVIGIELPNRTRQTVYLRELLNARDYNETKAGLPLILGQDIGGYPVIADLSKMPHLLVAGTTGSGKSVSVNAMILSLLFKLPPTKCKFIMIDPKMLELSVYDDIPHLLTPVVTDPKKAIVALKWAVKEMENRYRAMSKLGVRNIDGFNTRLAEARRTGEILVRRVQTGFDPETGKPIFENQGLDYELLPYIVVVVDEMADLMLVAGKEIEATIQRLAQMARAAGIHLIMATQRPSVDVITGTIKANFPTRISFQVTSKIDSRTILSEQGAEQLLGQGDMLHMAGGGRISRVHGPFIRDDEVERVVAFLKTQGEPSYVEGVTDDDEESTGSDSNETKGGDATYNQAVEVIMREGKVSTSFIQRHLQIGYNRAARIVEQMEKEGLISQANHAGKREILR
ncbi:MAG: DNA translocase FtsK 4TM domain-containing protein [Candidatus Paracaedibacteraceae bacterium]|nr:DNA translocase FtsK 4TM domain-containing protein [Candidatus Paracaedibacteraceae bacterium]